MNATKRITEAGAALLTVVGIALAEPAQSSSSQTFTLLEATIGDVHAAMRSGRITCRELVQSYLDRIEAYDKQGPNLNAVQTLNPRALEDADRLDEALESGGERVGALHCIPVLLKDQVETSDMPTTYGSAVFRDFVPARDATIVGKMKSAGAIILAKTTMGEFASRYVGSAFGIIRNAYDPTRNPSGSSGGTGAGVAANFGMVGIGEDTGGSIRGPAAVHSLVGLRPSVPLVSRFGMMPAKPANDMLAPVTRTVEDAAILLDVIAGYDPDDPMTAYSVGHVPDSYSAFLRADGLEGVRLGIVREPMDAKTDRESEDYRKVRMVIDAAIRDLGSLGAELVDPVTIPDVQELIEKTFDENDYETEEATNHYLAEHPNAPASTLRQILVTGPITPWRATSLLNVVGKSTNDAAYLPALHAKERLRLSVVKLMADLELDALVYATFDHQPTPIAPDVLTNPNPDDAYGIGNNRYLSPVIGFPAITVPAGFTADALPVGIELMGRPFTEGMLLQYAYAYEQKTRHRKPPESTPELNPTARPSQ
ncbi:MAG TPA: amidase family protein [Vicinamibacteria bacterium]|nr:amidase family protein [Vicinamibacteria bacterium]